MYLRGVDCAPRAAGPRAAQTCGLTTLIVAAGFFYYDASAFVNVSSCHECKKFCHECKKWIPNVGEMTTNGVECPGTRVCRRARCVPAMPLQSFGSAGETCPDVVSFLQGCIAGTE